MMNRVWIMRKTKLKSNLLLATNYFKHNNLYKSSVSSSSDGEQCIKSENKENKETSESAKRRAEAVKKLNLLLQKTIQEEAIKTKSKLDLAKPRDRRKEFSEKVDEAEESSKKKEFVEKNIVKAVKDVAQSVGGDAKQTESELLLKLLTPEKNNMSITTNLSDIVKGMKIDRESKPIEQQTRASQIQHLLQRVKMFRKDMAENDQQYRQPKRILPEKRSPEPVVQKIDLFGSKPLGIFTDNSSLKDSVENKTWNRLYEKELKLAITQPPSNYFQQMILWTEQGKIWKFPIDNEQGLEDEQKVYFAEHIFLEKHLEPWCPTKGPIRHFMELVCVGLSKNPYITVQAKKEHIEWYKNYFEDKKKLLLEVGAIPTQTKDPVKQIEE